MTVIIRLVLTAGLIVMVYRETGPWTALSFGLLTIANEIAAVAPRRDRRERGRQ